MIKFFMLVASLGLVGFGLVACVDTRPPRSVSVVYPQPLEIEGDWVDGQGIHSSFRNGYFETRATDTQEKLSEGNYVMRSSERVDIEIHSLVRGTVSRVTCSFAGPTQLLCRTPEGTNFSLYRNG